MLHVALLITLLQFPGVQILAGAYETEGDCVRAAKEIDSSTPVVFKWRCEVNT